MSDIPQDHLDTVKKIEEKYAALHQDAGSFLKGFLYQRPLTYWDYVEVDTLLTLQKPRTNYPDEPIFIMYHQVTELLLKLIVHELKQIVHAEKNNADFFTVKLERVNRYAGILTQSFSVMREGMDYDQYNEFRLALAPASGFQSAQFRVIEIMCTALHNLLNHRVKGSMSPDASIDELFGELYWLDAGYDRKTGRKTQLMQLFEVKYVDSFKRLAAKMREQHVLSRYHSMLNAGADVTRLKHALRNFDHTYNVIWPLAHLKTAEYYLNSRGEGKAATGGSEWQKYLHPSYQRRIFFPELWTEEELKNWGQF
ncbi:MAG: tryptophan 2,3-dioxygenase family protein [Bacteroidetes bacterium]|nr:tryptophan 2,3-dioxygenase family protein [Bacteroidota bacterium]